MRSFSLRALKDQRTAYQEERGARGAARARRARRGARREGEGKEVGSGHLHGNKWRRYIEEVDNVKSIGKPRRERGGNGEGLRKGGTGGPRSEQIGGEANEVIKGEQRYERR